MPGNKLKGRIANQSACAQGGLMTGSLVVHSPLDAFEICEELGEVVISKPMFAVLSQRALGEAPAALVEIHY
ncbi:uncharacterized protein FFB20_09379 [Fusarium fujikuroi]|uniref:Uncharacterized protein n=1 Tax=Fusarium fujikuroi TaxID=5127 RepID=A0A2H3SBR5_FUSFU|nr:uncharacterized protein FFB20_09379 [Fusarium fujikuroi]SCN95637.1 uncharacterized protein FFE2_08276 [Fusarium fujikuroi]SCO01516.1 uncharacterized protein FFM5_07601 [Fusarium fujikuroi]SCO21323.1 uncharacterized protein FFC1_14121 [Fusarium fujikuroi]SCO46026.1 uncharacterized protein FFNC_10636 [Fusarium fujikuroi]